MAKIERERGADGRLREDAYVLAERYAVGELSREELIERLASWSYTPGKQKRDWDDIGVTPKGSFGATVVRAADDGLIDGRAVRRDPARPAPERHERLRRARRRVRGDAEPGGPSSPQSPH